MTPSQFDLLIRRLIAVKTPKVVILLILLISWLDVEKHEREFQVVEFYAGVGRVASLAKWVGYKTAAIDVLYGENRAKPGGRKPMDINGSAGFVLCVLLLLNGEWEAMVCTFAIVCSSWVPVNRHSTHRSLLTPLGNENFTGVRRANKMTSRTVILILIVVLSGGTYLMENPALSLIALHPRYIWVVDRLAEFGILTHKVSFWMRKYLSMSWKRTWVWGNTRRIAGLDLGPMTDQEREDSEPTTTTYIDAAGKKRFKGNPNLKRSQQYTFRFASTLVSMVPKLREDSIGRKMPVEVVEGSLVELFNRLPWDEEGAAWELEADLKELIIYVRGSKKLRIPSEWRCAIPTAI
ncbi:unnamed protein product [Durusdinium trenchii]|uniref:Uncharacterized protein n=1 Tax=Durusdinium trenchii TaxID=1381693 RepID=A0ABP0QIY0_9DINO